MRTIYWPQLQAPLTLQEISWLFFSISTRGLNECMIVCMSVRNGILFEGGRIIWETATILGQKNKSWLDFCELFLTVCSVRRVKKEWPTQRKICKFHHLKLAQRKKPLKIEGSNFVSPRDVSSVELFLNPQNCNWFLMTEVMKFRFQTDNFPLGCLSQSRQEDRLHIFLR